MNITNNFNLPEPIVRALTKNAYSRGASNRSITQLINSPRITILQAEHDHEIYEDASDRMWSVLGTAVHNIFEDNTDSSGDHAEERVFYDTHGWTISGAIDLQSTSEDGLILSDYKCTSVWSVIFGKDDWVTQLNGYAWLLRMAKGVAVDKLQVVAVLRDWQRREAGKNNYPMAPIQIVNIPLWDAERQDAYMNERIEIHSDAEFERLTGGDLPLCTDEERWAKPTTYAVMKGKNKRATKVCDSHQEAVEYISAKNLDEKTHHIDERPGECTRCTGNYCHVAQFCDQFQAEIDDLPWGDNASA